MKKKSIFWQKPWAKTLCKIPIFSTFIELHFSNLKIILFYPEYQNLFLSGFLCSKKPMRKKSIFWQKPWAKTLCKIPIFSTFLEPHFSGLKIIHFYSILEYQNMFLTGFLCWKKKPMRKKVDFFYKNHGLTPLQNFDFFHFVKNSLFRYKNHCFLSRISKNVFCWLSSSKKNLWEKRTIFWQKPRVSTPFQNFDFFLFFKLHYSGLNNILLYPEYKNMFLSGFLCSKKTYEKKVDFLTKTMD